mmetsp:Transcript_17890/g.30068  ORF Transcript_17890/g.30068 Transcript_17890/m.30068 type:complete len:131 (-) Transcript_17890:711-1103(-)
MARGRGRGGGKPGRRSFTSRDQLEQEGKDLTAERKTDMPESDSDGSGSESEEEEDTGKKKGVAGLIEISNPNAPTKKNTKAKDLDINDEELDDKPQLSRRERYRIFACCRNTKYKFDASAYFGYQGWFGV